MGNRTTVDIEELRKWFDDINYSIFRIEEYGVVDDTTDIFTTNILSVKTFTVLKHGVPP